MKIKESIKNFKFKDHLFVIIGLAIFLILLLVGNGFVNSAKADNDRAKAATVETDTDIASKMQLSQTTEYIEVHNPNTVRINYAEEKIANNESLTGDYRLQTQPGDAMDDSSPEYYQQRVMSDKAFIENWIKPAFTYNNIDDYFTNRDIMKEQFESVDKVSGSAEDFFTYIMPPADDLKFLSSDEKSAYNGKMLAFNQYVIDADVLEAPYTFKYFATFTMASEARRADGSKTDAASSVDMSNLSKPNYCVVYTITRTADGYPELQSIYFTSVMSTASN